MLLRIRKITGVIIITLICLSPGATAGELASARSVAMGGALTALADGVDAAKYNPANLGLASYQQTGVELVGFGLNVSNNSFTLSDYNQYSGAVLSTSDKSDILGKVPTEGLRLRADAEVAALAASYGSIAFHASVVGAADLNLSKDILELILNGNAYADTISITGSYTDGIAYAQFGLSYGRMIYKVGSRELAVGATLKLVRGFGIDEVVESYGMMTTLATGFQGDGKLVARTASSGTGYGLDIGATLQLNYHYAIGLRFENILGSIKWNRNTEEHGYTFSVDTLTLKNINKDYFVSDDYTKPIPSFSTNLPTVMNIGFANTTGKLLWAIDWEQGFYRTASSSTKPRLSIGLEWLQLGMMPLRFGISSGGDRGSSFSLGSGVDAAPFYLDFATVIGTGVSIYSSKGLKFAVSTGIRF